MNFESELQKGIMIISECKKCKKNIWPPSEFCSQCLEKTSWKKCSKHGKIIEFSKQNDSYFGVAEFENSLRIMGKIISGIPNIGAQIEMIKCGLENGSYFITMRVVE